MKRPNEDFVKHLCWLWIAGIVVTLLFLVLAGCASYAPATSGQVNKMMFSLGQASQKIEAMNNCPNTETMESIMNRAYNRIDKIEAMK